MGVKWKEGDERERERDARHLARQQCIMGFDLALSLFLALTLFLYSLSSQHKVSAFTKTSLCRPGMGKTALMTLFAPQ